MSFVWGESSWTVKGITDLKHLSERVKKHEASEIHIENDIKFNLFGNVNISNSLSEAFRISNQRHNEQVDKNRHVLNRIINCIKFCGTHELPLRGHDEGENSCNRGVFLDLVSEIASLDSILSEHLRNATVSKNTSKTIQNELLDCMYEVYRETILKEIQDAKFVAVQADETTDISCMSQMVILLRYVIDSGPVERLVSFVNINDRTAEGIASVLKEQLEPFKLQEKLIAQSYDGAAVFSGGNNGVQVKLRESFPYAHFIHCYAHQLNIVIKKACSSVNSMKLFFINISGFSSFFSVSPKRTDLLRTVCGRVIPKVSETRWNFHSRVVNTVYNYKESLLECFEIIQTEDGWDDITIREAYGLANLLNNPGFAYLLSFFNAILLHIDILYSTLQKSSTNATTVRTQLQHFESAINDIRNNLPEPDCNSHYSVKRVRKDSDVRVEAREACDIIVNQIKHRFEQVLHTPCFDLIEPRLFAAHKDSFPKELVTNAVKFYPMLSKDKLESELTVVYRNNTFKDVKSVLALWELLKANNLENALSEVHKLTDIVLTTPISTAESERCFSTLKRVKTYLRNSMGQERLNALSVLSIHKEMVAEIPSFNQRVIDLFASQKNRRAHFLYK